MCFCGKFCLLLFLHKKQILHHLRYIQDKVGCDVVNSDTLIIFLVGHLCILREQIKRRKTESLGLVGLGVIVPDLQESLKVAHNSF